MTKKTKPPRRAKATSINFGAPATQTSVTIHLSPELEAVISNVMLNNQSLLITIDRKLDAIMTQERHMADTLDDVMSDVESEKDIVASAVALLDGINAKLTAAGNDPAKLKALRESLSKQKQDLAEAVARNTPAASSEA